MSSCRAKDVYVGQILFIMNNTQYSKKFALEIFFLFACTMIMSQLNASGDLEQCPSPLEFCACLSLLVEGGNFGCMSGLLFCFVCKAIA